VIDEGVRRRRKKEERKKNKAMYEISVCLLYFKCVRPRKTRDRGGRASAKNVIVVVDDDDASSVDLLFHRFAGFLGHVSLDALAPS
jgi:hypothetical protein